MMLELDKETKSVESENKNKTSDEISEKEYEVPKSDNIKKEQKISDIHISFMIAFVESDFLKVNNMLSKDPSLVNMKNPFDGNTALHFASKFGDIALIRALIGNYKADVNIRNHSGKTPLHYSAEFDREDVASLLVSIYDARKDIRDYSGKLPIDWAKPEKLEAMEKILGKQFYESIKKEEKGLSVRLKNLGSMLTHEGSPKHLLNSFLKGDSLPPGHKSIPNSSSADALSSKTFLSLSSADLDKPILKRSLGSKIDKSFNKAGPGIRGSFHGN